MTDTTERIDINTIRGFADVDGHIFGYWKNHHSMDTLVYMVRDETPAGDSFIEGETVATITRNDGAYTVCVGEATGEQTIDASTVVSEHGDAEGAMRALAAQFN